MLEEGKKILTKRRIISTVVILVIAIPTTIIVHAEASYGSYGHEPSSTVRIYSLKDVWYPLHGDWQPYPLFISGSVDSYYSRPFLMYPSSVELEFLIKDSTNINGDLSWFSAADYTIVSAGQRVNVTLDPYVNGSYGDGEAYVANQSKWVIWNSEGLPFTGNPMGAGLYYHSWNYTGYYVSDCYSFLRVTIAFGRDTSLHSLDWSLLIEIAILQEEAFLIAGHQIEIIVAYTTTWKPTLVFELPGSFTQSDMIVRGDNVTDNGIMDYNFYMLQGDISIQYGHV
jgi:hypothetical protein